jgi:hypothetical protein
MAKGNCQKKNVMIHSDIFQEEQTSLLYFSTTHVLWYWSVFFARRLRSETFTCVPPHTLWNFYTIFEVSRGFQQSGKLAIAHWPSFQQRNLTFLRRSFCLPSIAKRIADLPLTVQKENLAAIPRGIAGTGGFKP